jgi:hypothetical protein
MSPDQPVQQPREENRPNGSAEGENATYDRDKWADDAWEYAIGDTDIVVEGAVYDGELWERDGEGGVRPRQSIDEQMAREREEAALDRRFYEAREAAEAEHDNDPDISPDLELGE